MHKEKLLFTSDSYDVLLQYGLVKPHVTGKSISTQEYSQFSIRLHEVLSLDELITGPVWRLQSFCAFVLGFYPSVDSLTLTNEDGVGGINTYMTTFPSVDRKVSISSVPVAFDAVGMEALPGIVANWLFMDGDERHGCEVLTSLLGPWRMPFDLQVLAATTMLESLARARSERIYEDDQFDLMIKPALDELPEAIKQRAHGVLGLLKRPSYSMLLDSVYEECAPWSEKLIHDWKRFKKEQQAIRIQGAHGLSSGHHMEMMVNHYYGQIVLAYYLLMLRLGFDSKVIQRFEESSFLNAARWRIECAYGCNQ